MHFLSLWSDSIEKKGIMNICLKSSKRYKSVVQGDSEISLHEEKGIAYYTFNDCILFIQRSIMLVLNIIR